MPVRLVPAMTELTRINEPGCELGMKQIPERERNLMIVTDTLSSTMPGAEFSAAFGHLQTQANSWPTAEKISVRHLDFYYEDGKHALKDVSMPVYAERVTALIGPSGCGKSTL